MKINIVMSKYSLLQSMILWPMCGSQPQVGQLQNLKVDFVFDLGPFLYYVIIEEGGGGLQNAYAS